MIDKQNESRNQSNKAIDIKFNEDARDVSDVSDASDVDETPILLKETFWLTRLFVGNKVAPIPKERKPYPLINANLFSKLTLSWVSEIIKIGYHRRIEDEDLYELVDDLAIQNMTTDFGTHFEKRIKEWKESKQRKSDEKFSKYVLLLALNDTFWERYWFGGVFRVICDVTQVVTPLLVRSLVRHVHYQESDPSLGKGKAIGYCFGISLLLILSSLANCNFFHMSMLSGAQVKAVLTNIAYNKSFKLSAKSKMEFPNGKVNTLVMTDLARIDLALGVLHFIWSFTIALAISIAILIVFIGPSALVGIATCLVVIFFVFALSKALKSLRKKTSGYIDSRVSAVREVVNAMKMIKFYCWEMPYYQIISNIRDSEKKHVLKMRYIKSSLFSLVTSTSILAQCFTFLTLYGVGSGNFKSYNIFSSLALFSSLRQPLSVLPSAVAFVVDGNIALDRVTEFLQAEESDEYVEFMDINESENSIEIENGTFTWNVSNTDEESKISNIFDNIDLKVQRGEFIVITGSVGSGKSSLLNAIHGTIQKITGSVKIFGSMTFCSIPWIQNETIRENILFGKPYDKDRYWSIIKYCSLEDDLKLFSHGDQTEVGERGITLSGGQKARINLARAVYADSDIILMDDVLSAVDAKVGKHIMDSCICGFLKNKTRILATHQLSLINSADRVVFVDGSGKIIVGKMDEVKQQSKEFTNLMNYSTERGDDNEGDDEDDKPIKEKDQINFKKDLDEKNPQTEDKRHNIIEKEYRSSKSISWDVYYRYAALGSGKLYYIMLPFFMFCAIINGFLLTFYSVWLSFWISDRFGYSNPVYAGLFALFSIMSVLSNIFMLLIVGKVNNEASLKLFKLALMNILRTPMSFMDTTPIGRILNRFTKDIDTLDSNLADQFSIFYIAIVAVFSTFIMCGVYIPYLFISYPFIAFLYLTLSKYYQTSALDIKRLEANNRSNVFSHFNETLSGMSTVISYGSDERFSKKFNFLIDKMDMAYFITIANQRWLAIRLDTIAAGITLLVTILCVCGVFNLNSSSTGLLVSYIIQISGIISMLMRNKTQVENDMNSAERLYEYAYMLPQESAQTIEPGPSQEWPEHGAVIFQDVSLRYREGLPLVLKNVSFDIRSQEKIGICGRTGAGKSTIMNALFRINELVTGKIFIDGIDISTVGLDQLRSKLSIIPQDPVLFKGTVRQNLDPFQQYTDLELWDSLRRSWLIEDLSNDDKLHTDSESEEKNKFHLDQLIEDDGENFSLGEKQLIALARALVRNSKILVMDEATSSVDYETDTKIQSTIANEFANCTILCIAHRLKTILKYDRILVLDAGEISEFDTPINLFRKNGVFTDMCQRSGITEVDFS
ncbi:putative membrane protein [Wickerhamomyces ciferrii]|uniref:Membrane protein n=1 Tax=Wickerhamomyces ciferrii (strain ATCC 14091 / BCRC 22168 / CBS 111 / JCM 3599 / NBRC 0793 / NRRL Y-1031 F-60-10) TaxID=1206466 RepID=K0KH01_WICCF|nr:uncharacterized protein BN7_1003 [Wickerhamomyces ciferrii]CCH41462.1 putative membrane protein [Wickerhamomyces ciferrii]